MKKILVTGAGGFIGFHLVKELVRHGHYVVGADIKYPLFGVSSAHEFYQVDLRDPKKVESVITADIDEIYQLAADMGGTGYIGTGEHDSDIMHNSALININMVHEACKKGIKKILYTSSACVYPERNQEDPSNPLCSEDSVYPAEPDTEYGWEKLFSERLYLAHRKNYGIDAKVVRLHNVFGPQGAWNDGKEKAPAALCRKVAECVDGGTIDIWGPGTQTRSFLYIDECLTGLELIMASSIDQPINLGSDRMICINDLALLIARLNKKQVLIRNIDGPLGVMGRTSDNNLIRELLDWAPDDNLEYGLIETYKWIKEQVHALQQNR
jgi:nucleoside-diphosphate-sugar epimerase